MLTISADNLRPVADARYRRFLERLCAFLQSELDAARSAEPADLRARVETLCLEARAADFRSEAGLALWCALEIAHGPDVWKRPDLAQVVDDRLPLERVRVERLARAADALWAQGGATEATPGRNLA
jgi:hypothetical protein